MFMVGDEQRVALYKKIIERYKNVIEEREAKSIPELKELIQPRDERIQKLREEIISGFHPYIFERDFEAAAGKAFEFVRNEILNEALPLEFWLSIEDILELRVADEMDKAILLCSLLIALENDSARVVVATDGGGRHAFVVFEFKNVFHLFDPFHGIRLEGGKKMVLEKFFEGSERGKAYEFSNSSYEEW